MTKTLAAMTSLAKIASEKFSLFKFCTLQITQLRFSIECRETKTETKTKTKAILLWPITTNVNNMMNQWKLEENIRNQRQARENACDQAAIGFGFASDWLSRWRKIFKPITA